MCTPADAAANVKGNCSIGNGQLENREAQVGLFGGLMAFFTHTLWQINST